MSVVSVLSPERRDAVLEEAAGRNVVVVISRKESSAWATYKSRCLDARTDQRRVVIEYPAASREQSGVPAFANGENLGLAFRRGHKKCVCAAVVIGIDTFELSQGQTVRSLVVSWPDEMQELQRRAYYRASVPRGRTIDVEFWQGGMKLRKKAGTRLWPSYHGRLADISAGGLGVQVDATKNPGFHVGDGVGVQFQPNPQEPPLLLDAIYRHVKDAGPGMLSVGLQFAGLEATVEGRRLLQQVLRVVNQFQRYELRQAKLSASMSEE